MKSFSLILLLAVCTSAVSVSQQVPQGYLLQYEQRFNASRSIEDFDLHGTRPWVIQTNKDNYFLQLPVEISPAESSLPPENIAVLKNRILGDFILEADIMPYAGPAGIKEACLFLGLRDTGRYYCIQLTAETDSLPPAIYVIKNGLITRITDTTPFTWKEDKWHRIRVERNITNRTIRVFVDNLTVPVMYVKDFELVMGSVGFGSAACGGRFDNIRIWAPTVISEQ